MRFFDHSSQGPALVLHPQPPHQPFNMAPDRPAFTPFANGIQQPPSTKSCLSLTSTQQTPRLSTNRKRSRDDDDSNLEDCVHVDARVTHIEHESDEDYEYGEGMTLRNLNRAGYIMEAGSQTGTWAEERTEQEKAKKAAIRILKARSPERPKLRASKSQRLDISATIISPEEPIVSSVTYAKTGSPERHTEPTVDDFTRHLGIGWSSMANADPDIQAAARGWNKFIENHFQITGAEIRLQSKGLASYLVEAKEGYFLFGEDLKRGRLVSKSLQNTWINLQGVVPVFDSDIVMEAAQTPKPAQRSFLNGVRGIGWPESNETANAIIVSEPVEGVESGSEFEMDIS